MKPKLLASNRLRGKKKHMDAPLPPTTLTQPAPTAKWGDKLHHKGINVFLIVIGSVLFLGVNIAAYYFGTRSSKSQLSQPQFIQQIFKNGFPKSGFFSLSKQKPTPSVQSSKIIPTFIIKQVFACDPNGLCNSYADPKGYGGCPVVYKTQNCDNNCKDKNNWCKN